MRFLDITENMLSEGGKISSKRVIAVLFSLLAIYLAIFDDNMQKLDAILMFIASLLALSVANKHKALRSNEPKEPS